MEVFLVRHAIARERNRSRWPDDSQRPLTPAGIRKFEKAARGLARYLPKPVLLLTSPFLRARQTAAILARSLHCDQALECPELAAGQPARAAFELLGARSEAAIVLVGHEPNLSSFISMALEAEGSRLKFEFKKGGAACLRFPGRVTPERATLEWLLPPRVLRALR